MLVDIHRNGALLHIEQSALRGFAQQKPRVEGAQKTIASLHPQRPAVGTAIDPDLALKQLHLAPLGSEGGVDRAGAVELHLAAVAQRYPAPFASGRAVVGQQGGQGRVVATEPGQPGGASQQPQHLQTFTPADAPARAIQGMVADASGNLGKLIMHARYALPHPLMLGAGLQPLLERGGAGVIGDVETQLYHPLDSLVEQARVNVRHTATGSRRAALWTGLARRWLWTRPGARRFAHTSGHPVARAKRLRVRVV